MQKNIYFKIVYPSIWSIELSDIVGRYMNAHNIILFPFNTDFLKLYIK